MPAWITEGTALWLASDQTHIEETMVASQWRLGWLGRPGSSLFDRSYDAFGYYALLDTHNWDLWGSMAAAWRVAAASPRGPSIPFLKALDGDDLEIRQAWGPSLMRRPNWGKAWETFGFGLPGDAQARRTDLTALRAAAPRHLLPYSAEVTEVTGTAGEIVIVETDGLAAAHDESNHAVASFTHERLCTTKDCICPKGTERAGENMAETRMDIPFQLAFSAPAAGADSTVTARTLAEECGLDEPPVPTPVGSGEPPGADLCPGGCASSNGDPHLRTVDNHAYDFQAVGEFVLLRDADTGVEIQVRQAAFGEHASVNSAVAARVGDRRVGFYMVGDTMQTRIDGVLTDATAAVDLGGGAKIVTHPEATELTLADGTVVWLLPHGQYGIIVQLAPSDALRADGGGLLGPVAPGGSVLPLLADGTPLPRPKSVEERHQFLYERFADSWRVSDATSLFDYGPGQSTTDFTDRAFPTESADVSIASLPDEIVAGAMDACAGIADATLWLQCIYDVGVTGNSGFAELYALAQALLDDGVAAPDGEPATPAPAVGSIVGGPVAPILTGLRALLGSALADDGTLYLSVQLADGRYQVVAVDPAASEVLKTIDVAGGGVLAIAAGSVWIDAYTPLATCAISRFQLGTLATEAVVATPCWQRGEIAALDGAVWVVDPTGVNADGEGGHLVRIDPATNAPGARVEVVMAGGFLSSSADSLFFADSLTGVYRLDAGATDLDHLADEVATLLYPATDGVWVQDGPVANFFDAPGGPTHSIDIDGFLVGADDTGIYVQLANAVDGTAQLWRYAIDGGTPKIVAEAPTIGTGDEERTLNYADNVSLFVARGMLVKLFVVHALQSGEDPALFLQRVPVG